MRSNDLASLMVPHDSPGVRYGLGKIISWNAETFENVIEYNGLPIENMKLLSGTDALSYAPGQSLMLMFIDSTGAAGITQGIILGRLFTPGSDNAEALVSFMRGTLARQIAAEVFAARIHTNIVEGIAQRTSAIYGNPTSGDPGPTCAGVDITDAGKAVVMLGCLMRSATGTSIAAEETGHMSVEITGASSVPASDVNSAYLNAYMIDSAAIQATQTIVSATVGRVIEFNGLNPGTHTFTAKYRHGPAHDNVYVYNRSMVVFAY